MRRRLAVAGGAWVVGFFLAVSQVTAATPVLSSSGPGRFEIASLEAGPATLVRTEAEGAWRLLAEPLGLPEQFPTPIFVRIVPAAEWPEVAPFRVFAEPGGVVSLRLRWSEVAPKFFVRRALVQALLVRLAVAEHGVQPQLTAPLWLEQAAVGWWRTRDDPAMLDQLQQDSLGLAPPRLAEILGWTRSEVEPRVLEVGSVWLLAWLQRESAGGREWRNFRRRLLVGEDPSAALAASFPGRFSDLADRELWWQTGWHGVRRVRTLPMWSAAESRQTLADLSRVVLAVGEQDAVLPLRFALRRRDEPAVAAVLAAKTNELERVLPALHVFYRNVGLALADCLAPGKEIRLDADGLVAEFEREWREGFEMETKNEELMDEYATGRRAGRTP